VLNNVEICVLIYDEYFIYRHNLATNTGKESTMPLVCIPYNTGLSLFFLFSCHLHNCLGNVSIFYMPVFISVAKKFS